MSQNSSASSVLKAARDLIAQGWCQVAGHVVVHNSAYDRYCAVMAIDESNPRARIRGDETTEIACEAVCQALGMYTCSNWVEPLIDWNDAPCRTQQEVLAAFDRAIAIAEIEEELSTLKEEEHEPELTAV